MADADKDKKAPSAEPLEVTAPGQLSRHGSGRGKKKTSKAGAGTKRKVVRGSKESGESAKPAPKEKQVPELVIPDPRLRETRNLIIHSCGMDKEREDYDHAFEEHIKKIQQAVNQSDTSTQENRDDEKEAEKIKKKKKKKDDEVKETYNNDEDHVPQKHQDSPNAKSPEAGTAMMEDMDFDLRVTEMTHVKKLTVWTLTSVLMSNFFRLPIFLVVTKFYVTYGASFIGVCGLLMLAVGLPIIFLEMNMGQFTSLPPNTFFARISPIAQGVGISMILLRIFAMMCIHVDIRYIFLFFQHLSLASSQVDDRCAHAGMPFCRTHDMCQSYEEPGMYGACLKKTEGFDVPFKDKTLGEVMNIRALQISPSQLLVDNELSEHNVYTMGSFLLIMLVSGIPLIDGAELLSTMAPFLLASSFLTPVVIFWNLEIVPELGDMSRWRAGFHGGMDAFSDPFAWIVAFCLICSMFNVGEGTWVFIGSWLNFRHKQTLRSLLYTTGCQLLLMFLFSFVFTAWAVNVVAWQHNGFLAHDEILEILRDRPLEFWLRLPIQVIPDKRDSYMFLAYLLLTINSLGYVITTGEYVQVSLIRALPFLVRVPKVKLRGGVLMKMIAVSSLCMPFLMDAHIFKQARVHYAYIGMLMAVILYEVIVFVYIYGIQRVLVNLKVIYRNTPSALILYSRMTEFLKLCYRFILTWFLMLGFAYASEYISVATFSMLTIFFLAVLLMPWLVAFYKIAVHSQTTHSLVTLFRADARFGPAAEADRKQAVGEENKMGSAGLN